MQAIDGRTALHLAVDYQFEEVVQILLDCGASPNTKTAPNQGYAEMGRETPLHLAVRTKNVKIGRLLIERGADPFSKNKFGHTPLDDTRDAAVAKLLPPQSKTSVGKRTFSLIGVATADRYRVARKGISKLTDEI